MGFTDEDLLFKVTPIEQISPRGWPRYIFPFELPADYNLDEVTQVLRDGWEATCRRLPVLKGEVVADPDAKQGGAIKIQLLDEKERLEHIQPITVNDLRSPEAYPLTFSELKERHFPVSAFDPEIFTRRYTWPSPGDRLPIMLMQLNFIRGGLILNWNPFHMIGDGTTFFTWTAIWAEECRRAQGLHIPEPLELRQSIVSDRRHAINPQSPSSGKSGRLEDHPQYVLLTDPAKQLAKVLTSEGHLGQIFYFSKESLEQLKKDVYPQNPRPGEPTYISTNDALTALAWRSIMAAQYPLEKIKGDEVSVFNMAIDGRLRIQPPIDEGTLGSFVEFIEVKMPLRRMLETNSVAKIALLIRKAIVNMDEAFQGTFTNDMIKLINNLEDARFLSPSAFLDCPGLSCSQTSWAKFELYGLQWGPLLGDRIKAIRSPSNGILNGMQIMMPELPDGGREMLCGINEEDLPSLIADPIWRNYAELR
ncbi:hypothetical protein N8I77_008221 [Diaporthe amygdali]|uniref:Trichothecene 3-O-acetyltransferase-like N-terminal domain-containing protein n=1 Tax=Phomopsis amygdali TaxID=1214568 RepID=A0AAD9SD91_PHOAM|nr:hypothetical protein N8I77_008221 [Diaporthe amygdali]